MMDAGGKRPCVSQTASLTCPLSRQQLGVLEVVVVCLHYPFSCRQESGVARVRQQPGYPSFLDIVSSPPPQDATCKGVDGRWLQLPDVYPLPDTPFLVDFGPEEISQAYAAFKQSAGSLPRRDHVVWQICAAA